LDQEERDETFQKEAADFLSGWIYSRNQGPCPMKRHDGKRSLSVFHITSIKEKPRG
jgi:hypothetical protein